MWRNTGGIKLNVVFSPLFVCDWKAFLIRHSITQGSSCSSLPPTNVEVESVPHLEILVNVSQQAFLASFSGPGSNEHSEQGLKLGIVGEGMLHKVFMVIPRSIWSVTR